MLFTNLNHGFMIFL